MGNELLGDDGVGPWIAKRINGIRGWIGLDVGTAPENFTSLIRREKPSLLVIIDATEMNLLPGEIRMIPLEKIPKLTYFSTHTLSLSFLIESLKGDVKNILFIGVQPKAIALGCTLSEEVLTSAKRLLNLLISNKFLEELTSL
ncbi:MAG: hydrogenase maturation peptidase HycI [Synergistetes bacterium]|nr:hydrogenase maturation peptidase HycI [Synergistota bacterium]MCX8127733.1 hydrogenase maturation peptidase HycI [Synergistota bacterium]MDW8191352.1 hydrogenase maturation peptidase HycI [Synergistota bacterium]